MAVAERTGTPLKIYDYVELRRDVERGRKGARGTIVDAQARFDTYLVELVDKGRTVEIVSAHAADLELIQRPESRY